mmetsp:Transcript_24531/g.35939  ORF Transcript_24531/g.35939 Transcript_24531/m.35939 type:complete len:210 (+) Transcript_24531:695-1324(+)
MFLGGVGDQDGHVNRPVTLGCFLSGDAVRTVVLLAEVPLDKTSTEAAASAARAHARDGGELTRVRVLDSQEFRDRHRERSEARSRRCEAGRGREGVAGHNVDVLRCDSGVFAALANLSQDTGDALAVGDLFLCAVEPQAVFLERSAGGDRSLSTNVGVVHSETDGGIACQVQRSGVSLAPVLHDGDVGSGTDCDIVHLWSRHACAGKSK